MIRGWAEKKEDKEEPQVQTVKQVDIDRKEIPSPSPV